METQREREIEREQSEAGRGGGGGGNREEEMKKEEENGREEKKKKKKAGKNEQGMDGEYNTHVASRHRHHRYVRM